MFKPSLRRTPVVLCVAGLAVAIGGTALAVTSSPAGTVPKAGNYTIYGCVSGSTRALEHVYTTQKGFVNGGGCPRGTFAIAFNSTGPAGPKGPSGVVSTVTTSLGPVPSVTTGGSFVAKATQVGTVALKAGTYLVSLNAKATPNVSSAIEVFPQFFVYNQVKNAAFTGDLFNVGSGPLASNNTSIDSYYSGSTVVTLAQATTLHVYAFGYDSDRSAGSYTLDDLTLTATKVNAG